MAPGCRHAVGLDGFAPARRVTLRSSAVPGPRADVLKIERPGAGDSTRTMGLPDPRDGTSLYWKLVGRNKRCATLDLKSDEGRKALLRLVDEAHVLIENSRPGVMERLGLAPDVLLERNPRLVICRVTAFGQDGPYAQRPGFATLAEAMSGFAAINGEADRGPLLPPIALTDEVAAMAAAFAIMVAVHSGIGQMVDVTLLESLLQCMGPLPSAYGMTGYLQPRQGSGLPYSVPRGTWRCRDGQWVAVSASAESVGRRGMGLIGLGGRDDLESFGGRIAAPDEIDARMAEFCAALGRRRGRRLRRGPRGGGTRVRHGGRLRRPASRGPGEHRRGRRRPHARPDRPVVGHPRRRPLGRPADGRRRPAALGSQRGHGGSGSRRAERVRRPGPRIPYAGRAILTPSQRRPGQYTARLAPVSRAGAVPRPSPTGEP